MAERATSAATVDLGYKEVSNSISLKATVPKVETKNPGWGEEGREEGSSECPSGEVAPACPGVTGVGTCP